MWIYLNDSFLSVVADQNDAEELLVRGRKAGDIEAVFPEAAVIETPANDYRFRASVRREVVAAQIAKRLLAIGYPNFKASVPDQARHDCYSAVWLATARGLADNGLRSDLHTWTKVTYMGGCEWRCTKCSAIYEGQRPPKYGCVSSCPHGEPIEACPLCTVGAGVAP